MTRGKIYCEQAYAQGKMLDNSSWELPRMITPSDIDLVFDDGQMGRIIFVELSSSETHWNLLSVGQRRLYSRLVAKGHGKVFAALCKHSVPQDQQINTRNDIDTFQVMYFGSLLGYATSPLYQGTLWANFVTKFYEGVIFTFPEPTHR